MVYALVVLYMKFKVDTGNRAIMIVDALATDGTKYEVYYNSDFSSFEHFLPTVENMVKSFKATGSESDPADIDLSLKSHRIKH
jgi:hypothetical protein